MTVYAITDTKKGEQGLRLLIFKLPKFCLLEYFINTVTVCDDDDDDDDDNRGQAYTL